MSGKNHPQHIVKVKFVQCGHIVFYIDHKLKLFFYGDFVKLPLSKLPRHKAVGDVHPHGVAGLLQHIKTRIDNQLLYSRAGDMLKK